MASFRFAFPGWCVRAGIVVSVLGGCAPDGAGGPGTVADWEARARDTRRSLDDRVSAILDGLAADPCAGEPDPDPSDCPSRTVDLGRGHVDRDLAPDERVLVADVLVPSVDMLRHRHRILGFYGVDETGAVVEIPAVFELPEVAAVATTAFAALPTPPAADLEALTEPLRSAYGARIPSPGTHGLVVSWILSDLVRDRGLVYLDINLLTHHQAVPEVVCSIDANTRDDAPAYVALEARAERAAAGLAELLVEERVGYVNASWGFTVETVRGPWESVCGETPPPVPVLRHILATYRPIFDVLFATPGVFTAHAALASSGVADAPFDQADPAFPNRLRIGSFEHGGDDIPADGAAAAPPGSRAQPQDPADADVFVNSGCVESTCRSQGALRAQRPPFGFGTMPFPVTQRSFVAPVALAELITRRDGPDHRDAPLDDETIHALQELLATSCGGPPCYRDPLRHR